MLTSIANAERVITSGRSVLLAGSESVLSRLPKGSWIGGTIPYFMDAAGGVCTETDVFLTEVPSCTVRAATAVYQAETLSHVYSDGPDNGFSVLIIPAGGRCHTDFAENAPSYDGAFMKPLVGWISGVHLSQLGAAQPLVFDGATGTVSADAGVAMHVTLPARTQAHIDIVNVFRQGSGPTITFPRSGFAVSECEVDGKPRNFAEFLGSTGADTRLPLMADYNGSLVNVSIQNVDAKGGNVTFYAPVFKGVQYRLAAPLDDYEAAFAEALAKTTGPAAFACNCILNYLYGGLEGKRTGSVTGPITFGEIAHQLLNQTLVRLSLVDVPA